MERPVPNRVQPGTPLALTEASHLVSSTFPAGSLVEVVEVLSRPGKPRRHGLRVRYSDPVGEPDAIAYVKPEEVEEV